jgi:hypothetical protein
VLTGRSPCCRVAASLVGRRQPQRSPPIISFNATVKTGLLWRPATVTRVEWLVILLALAVVHGGMAHHVEAQEADVPDRVRFGVSVGGTHRVGLSVEYLRGDNAAELAVGTFRWELLNIALTGRRYFRDGRMHPYVGVGIWSTLSAPGDGFGHLTFLRVPLGLDWNPAGNHYTGLEASLSYAVTVQRGDPEDTSPLRRRFLPLPALYYKYQGVR